MKKTVLLIALIVSGFASAQKGTVLVQGNVGFSANKISDVGTEYKTNSFSFAPRVGYQFTDNWTAGIQAYVATGKQTTKTSNPIAPNTVITAESQVTNFAPGAFVRYTKTLSETFKVYADLDANFIQSKNSSTSFEFDGFDYIPATNSVKATGFTAGITPAVFINVYKNFGLNFDFGGLGFATVKDKTPAATKNTAFEVTFGNTFNIGISKNF